MSIPRLKTGQQITSSLLNQIIDQSNSLAAALTTAATLNTETQDRLAEFATTLEQIEAQYEDTVLALPTLQDVLATFVEAKSCGISWTDASSVAQSQLIENIQEILEDTTLDAVIREQLTDYLSLVTATIAKLKIARVPYAQLAAWPKIDRQIIFDITNHVLYMDRLDSEGVLVRESYSGTGGGGGTIPSINIVWDINTLSYCWQIGEHIYNGLEEGYPAIDAVGAVGPTGPAGPTGSIGPRGLQGIQGERGLSGPAGANGTSSSFRYYYSNDPQGVDATETYVGQYYLGLRQITNIMTEADIEEQPITWIRISNPALFPSIDEDGVLTWSASYTGIPPAMNIKGPQGDSGASIRVLGQFVAYTSLPVSGAVAGDSFFVGTELWTYTGGTDTDPATGGVGTTYHGFLNVGNVQGPAGADGADGADGVNGNRIFSYSDNPYNHMGDGPVNGDIAIVTTTGDIYKYTNGWNTLSGVNVKRFTPNTIQSVSSGDITYYSVGGEAWSNAIVKYVRGGRDPLLTLRFSIVSPLHWPPQQGYCCAFPMDSTAGLATTEKILGEYTIPYASTAGAHLHGAFQLAYDGTISKFKLLLSAPYGASVSSTDFGTYLYINSTCMIESA